MTSSYLIHGIFLSILFLKFTHEFNSIQSLLLTLSSAMLIQLINRGSFILNYSDINIILDRYRVIFEICALFADQYFLWDYGLQLILFGRFIDFFLFFMQIWPYVYNFLPCLIKFIEELLKKAPPKEPISRGPIYSD